MDGEYLITATVAAGETRRIPIPSGGISGVYCSTATPLKWEFNGTTADLTTSTAWEPIGGFHPRDTSYLIFDNTAGSSAVDITIRAM